MRKFLSLSLALLLLLGGVLMLGSCGEKDPIPELDFDEAVENLEEEGYYVWRDDEYAEEEESFYAYLKDDYISVTEYKSEEIAKLAYKNLKQEKKEMISHLKDQIDILEDLYDELKDSLSGDDLDELKDEIRYCEKQLEKYTEDYVIGRDGKIVWYGTRRAIKDSQ